MFLDRRAIFLPSLNRSLNSYCYRSRDVLRQIDELCSFCYGIFYLASDLMSDVNDDAIHMFEWRWINGTCCNSELRPIIASVVRI